MRGIEIIDFTRAPAFGKYCNKKPRVRVRKDVGFASDLADPHLVGTINTPLKPKARFPVGGDRAFFVRNRKASLESMGPGVGGWGSGEGGSLRSPLL